MHCVAMFRAAAEAQDGDILKLYNVRGSLISVGPSLPANAADTRYKLEVISACTSGTAAEPIEYALIRTACTLINVMINIINQSINQSIKK